MGRHRKSFILECKLVTFSGAFDHATGSSSTQVDTSSFSHLRAVGALNLPLFSALLGPLVHGSLS